MKNLSNCKLAPDWRDMARQDEPPDWDAQLQQMEDTKQLSPDTLAQIRAAIATRKQDEQDQEEPEAQDR